jgi:hypothetical protein
VQSLKTISNDEEKGLKKKPAKKKIKWQNKNDHERARQVGGATGGGYE